jgi:hypothetical protein
MDHVTLLYIIKKPQGFRRIVKWLLLFLDYDFLVVYKPRQSHLVADVLSGLPNVTKNIGILDYIVDVSLFFMQLIWL